MQEDPKQIAEMKNEIKNFIASTGYTELNKINDDTLIFKEGIIESIGFVQLVVFLEETFGIQVTDKDMMEENFESVNAIINLVKQKLPN